MKNEKIYMSVEQRQQISSMLQSQGLSQSEIDIILNGEYQSYDSEYDLESAFGGLRKHGDILEKLSDGYTMDELQAQGISPQKIDAFNQMLSEKNITVDKLAELIGKNRATIYRYESSEIEKLPTSVLEPLCKALGTTPAYIMGWTDPDTSQNENINSNKDIFSVHEKKVITAYRNKPEMQPAVDKLLGVEEEVLIPTVKAARSKDNSQPIEIVNLPDLSKFEPDDTDL